MEKLKQKIAYLRHGWKYPFKTFINCFVLDRHTSIYKKTDFVIVYVCEDCHRCVENKNYEEKK